MRALTVTKASSGLQSHHAAVVDPEAPDDYLSRAASLAHLIGNGGSSRNRIYSWNTPVI